MIDFDAQAGGIDKILRKMKALPGRIQNNILVGGVRACAKPIIKEAKRNAHKDSGALIKSIGVVKIRMRDKNIILFTIAPRLKKKHGYLAHFHEFGTSKMAAQPFMRPAFENKGEEAINALKEYMKKRIDKEISKL